MFERKPVPSNFVDHFTSKLRMEENLLHFVWKHRLFINDSPKTVTGDLLKIIDPGLHNSDAGPDFFNAKIKFNNTLWVGNVEIHIRSSDWYKHGHDRNPGYDSVILHVVKQYDKDIYRLNGEPVPQLVLSYPEHIDETYSYLLNIKKSVPCSLLTERVSPLSITSWLNVLQTERLEQKTERIFQLLNQCENNWEEVLYITLGRYFGAGVNGDAFERLTRSLPHILLLKHQDSLLQTEALLFGQAGILANDIRDPYFLQLKKEYAFLRHKYNLQPMDAVCWKSHRIRPANFPEIRIAQFAAFRNQNIRLFSAVIEADTLSDLRNLFKVRPAPYWKNHYNFGNPSPDKDKIIGNILIDTLLINVVIPVIFAFGIKINNQDLTEKALYFSEKLPPENNSIIREWNQIGLKVLNAGDTQSLIHLKKEYCDQKKCLFCRIGRELLAVKRFM